MVNYYLLLKPGIIFGNLVTFAAGFILASGSSFNFPLFLATLVGIAFIIASAGVFNNYIDRHIDKVMDRTKQRPLAAGAMNSATALTFGALLLLAGSFILYFFTNPLTALVANSGFFVYVCLYSPMKSRTTLSTLIGSISGAIPPVAGYCAVSNRLDTAALLLFLILFFWQMPHFFAIGIWRRQEYAKAHVPILPVVKGNQRTKIHMAVYILLLIPVLPLLSVLGYTGDLFFGGTLALGIAWLVLSLQGFYAKDDTLWGRQMFRASLLMINAICLLIYIDRF